jgi:hypothetical protein
MMKHIKEISEDLRWIKTEDNLLLVDVKAVINNNECYVGWEINYATEPKERWIIYFKGVGCNGNPHYKVLASKSFIDEYIPLLVEEELIIVAIDT